MAISEGIDKLDLGPPNPHKPKECSVPAVLQKQSLGSNQDLELEATHRPPQSHLDARNGPPYAASAEEPVRLSPKVVLKLLSAGFSFFVAGVNDGSIGTMIPYVLRGYGINTSFVAIL